MNSTFQTVCHVNSSTENQTNCSAPRLVLPIFNESEWSIELRVFLYLLGMIYTFVGISIAADRFMIAIEKITSKQRSVVQLNSRGQLEAVQVNVWNGTVANLTLMALGSSAPEIMLAVIEIIGNGFQSGVLGPSTIVGSAAFNLLCITAICIVAVPKRQTRRVEQYGVFFTTAIFSIFAYMWLLIVLLWISPNQVEVWEAAVTLLFLVVLLSSAFAVDKNWCRKPWKFKQVQSASTISTVETTASERPSAVSQGTLSAMLRNQRLLEISKANPYLTAGELAKLIAKDLVQQEGKRTRAYYRNAANLWVSRASSNTSAVPPSDAASMASMTTLGPVARKKTMQGLKPDNLPRPQSAVNMDAMEVQFAASVYGAPMDHSSVTVRVIRSGDVAESATVAFETLDGSALEGEHYVAERCNLLYTPNQREISVDIALLGGFVQGLVFFVRLTQPKHLRVGKVGTAEIQRVPAVGPAELCTVQFERPGYICNETDGFVYLDVVRTGAVTSGITVRFQADNITAEAEKDFKGGTGRLTFAANEVKQSIPIEIIDDMQLEKHEQFRVRLSEPTPVATVTLGLHNATVVTIVGDDDVSEWLKGTDLLVKQHMLFLRSVGARSWGEQFAQALSAPKHPTALDFLLHFIAFGWKVLFAFIPPPAIMQGWLTFAFSLLAIGLLTVLVGDLATTFGCLIGLTPLVNAITFVAIGTSTPDLFASRLAAVQGDTADDAIGNVTGSNSVNVFLGLGLPWLLASVYWRFQNMPFCVHAGEVAYSVFIFSGTSILCVLLLTLRRRFRIFGYAELGGPMASRIVSSLMLMVLWLGYVALSAGKSYGYID